MDASVDARGLTDKRHMSKTDKIHIIGIGDDGLDGASSPTRRQIDEAVERTSNFRVWIVSLARGTCQLHLVRFDVLPNPLVIGHSRLVFFLRTTLTPLVLYAN